MRHGYRQSFSLFFPSRTPPAPLSLSLKYTRNITVSLLGVLFVLRICIRTTLTSKISFSSECGRVIRMRAAMYAAAELFPFACSRIRNACLSPGSRVIRERPSRDYRPRSYPEYQAMRSFRKDKRKVPVGRRLMLDARVLAASSLYHNLSLLTPSAPRGLPVGHDRFSIPIIISNFHYQRLYNHEMFYATNNV